MTNTYRIRVSAVRMTNLVRDAAFWWQTPAHDRNFYALPDHPPQVLLCSERLAYARQLSDVPAECATNCSLY